MEENVSNSNKYAVENLKKEDLVNLHNEGFLILKGTRTAKRGKIYIGVSATGKYLVKEPGLRHLLDTPEQAMEKFKELVLG